MEGEISNCIKVCLAIFLSLSYCYYIGKRVTKGTKRLLFILPIICLFLLLPLNLTSINCGGTIGLYISWLANFKLLLFAFGKGPLSNPNPSISLTSFLTNASFPIEIKENPPQKPSHKPKNGRNKQTPFPKNPKKSQLWILNYGAKGLILAILVLRIFNYKEYFHKKVILFLYCLYVYLILDIVLSAMRALARALFGLELEPHFDEPYLSSSLQDFWGRRWNLMVSRALRPTVYEPTLNFSEPIIGRRWAPLPAVAATFLVSGLMHELIFYYWSHVAPTWEVTWFFVIHGFCLAVEIALKKKFTGRWRLPPVVSGILTVLFVMETCFWLFFPQILRCEADVRLLQEYASMADFLRNFTQKLPLI
ncbi:hypothetical protein UlMin_007418 [Ulmus minor]